MMWWPIDPIFNYSSSSEDRDERRTTSTSLKKSGSGKENNKPESASSKNSRSQGFGLPVNNVNAGSNLMSNLPTRTSSKPKATPTKIGTKNWVYSVTKVNMALFKNVVKWFLPGFINLPQTNSEKEGMRFGGNSGRVITVNISRNIQRWPKILF